MNNRWSYVVACAAILLLPAISYAQASLTGIVTDDSSAVLPGVTVEASSPALIERVRTAVTDSTGQYRIIDLRPGTYTVRFTLAGFSSVNREGVVLAGQFTATVNVSLKVGSIEETVTVTGESPTVDVQSSRQQRVLDQDVINALPTGRSHQALAVLLPGVIKGGPLDVGGSAGDQQVSYSAHGSRGADGRLQLDGLSIGAPETQGSNQSFFVMNVATSREVVFTTSGGQGEADTGGVTINVIPREGSNTFHTAGFFAWAGSGLQSTNYTPALAARGLIAPNRLKSLLDINPTAGGPLLRDRLWYFANVRFNRADNYIGGIYTNVNTGNATSWSYQPDFGRQGESMGHWKEGSVRFTLQASPRNKFNVFWDDQQRTTVVGSATSAPEAQGKGYGFPNRVQQLTWSSPYSNRVLLEAGASVLTLHWGVARRTDNNPNGLPADDPNLISVTEQGGAFPNLTYRGPNSYSDNRAYSRTTRASLSYVTGAHTAKFGYLGSWQRQNRRTLERGAGVTYRFNNGIPNQLTQVGAPFSTDTKFWNIGLYAQDQWTLNRLTVQGAIRFDRFHTWFPDSASFGPTPFLPTAITFPEMDGVLFKDVTPRAGAVYNVFGNGKTAAKVNIGKYLIAQDGGADFGSNLNPLNRITRQVSRTWSDANRNFVADCNLSSVVANGECGAVSDAKFGTSQFSTSYDPAVISGTGVRPYVWNFSVGIVQEVLPRVSVDFGYFRTWYGNFMTTDNRAVVAADFNRFTVTSPSNSLLPGGGGTALQYVDVTPAKFGSVDNLFTASSNFGRQIEHWNGFDLTVNARLSSRMTAMGGFSLGKTTTDNCEVVDKLPELLTGGRSPQFCHTETPFLKQYKLLATYSVPKIDVQLSGTLQSLPGTELQGNWVAPAATVAAALGRTPAGNPGNVTLAVVKPGTVYGDRINQVDFRVGKSLRLLTGRVQLNVDIFNILNANPGVTYNATIGSSYLAPTSIMPPRFAKLSLQVDF
jgi:hypothetical protein